MIIADSLFYIYNNREIIRKKTGSNGKFIVGGYSSGAHILLSVLQSGILQSEKYNIPNTSDLYDAILLISGVFSTRIINPSIDTYWDNFILKKFLQTIFKNSYTEVIKNSPFHNMEKHPIKLPFLIAYCKYEVFNIIFLENRLRELFSSTEFINKINKINKINNIDKQSIKIKNIEINSNHWSILNSNELINFVIENM